MTDEKRETFPLMRENYSTKRRVRLNRTQVLYRHGDDQDMWQVNRRIFR